jgi:pyroglutamyl-peptidase
METQRRGDVRVYVTGFGPFAEADVNPTQVLVEGLHEGSDVSGVATLAGCFVCDVDCEKSTALVATLREGAETVCAEPSASGAPAAVVFVHLGVFASATSFRVESRAYNEATFRYPDASGRQPRNVPIRPEDGGVDRCLRTTIPVDAVVQTLRGKGHDCVVSDDAGRYLCNWIYWESLRAAAACAAAAPNRNAHALFVHVPPFAAVPEETQRTFLIDLLAAVADACRSRV